MLTSTYLKKKKLPLHFYRGKKTNILIRAASVIILIPKLQDRRKYTGYNAGAMLDFYLELFIVTYSVVNHVIMIYIEKVGEKIQNNQMTVDEIREISEFIKWYDQYGHAHGHPILYAIIFITFVVPAIKVLLDKVVEHKTKARFFSYIEMLWAKRRKKYLDGIRASREDLGTEKYLKLVSVTNREYYSITGRRKPIWKSPYYKYSWWQKMFDWL